MITTLTDTTSSQIASELLNARRAMGSPAMGMVMTMIIVCTEAEQDSALASAVDAGREHPSRILVAVAAQNGPSDRLDAELRIGEGTQGETVILRMYGRTADHSGSVVRPLLLPDSPVVVWWPGTAPADLANHELGRLATRRVTDAMGAADPLQALRLRADNYQPGDTDLAWTRITQWRSLLAASLDQYPATVLSASVTAEADSASANILAAWLGSALEVPVSRHSSAGPGITQATMTTADGDIVISREDGKLASYTVPGQPTRLVALKRPPVSDLVAEELRRMGADDTFHEAILALQKQQVATT